MDQNTLLDRIGRVLYGSLYETTGKAQLGHDLNMAKRTVQRMAAGHFELPASLLAELLALLEARRDDVAALIAEIETILAEEPVTEEG